MEIKVKIVEVPNTQAMLDAMNREIAAANTALSVIQPVTIQAGDDVWEQMCAWLTATLRPLFDEDGKVKLHIYNGSDTHRGIAKCSEDKRTLFVRMCPCGTVPVSVDGVACRRPGDDALSDYCENWPWVKCGIEEDIRETASSYTRRAMQQVSIVQHYAQTFADFVV